MTHHKILPSGILKSQFSLQKRTCTQIFEGRKRKKGKTHYGKIKEKEGI